jgi:hypothetical protein
MKPIDQNNVLQTKSGLPPDIYAAYYASQNTQKIHFLNDSLNLDPGEYIDLLKKIDSKKAIHKDTYQFG